MLDELHTYLSSGNKVCNIILPEVTHSDSEKNTMKKYLKLF